MYPNSVYKSLTPQDVELLNSYITNTSYRCNDPHIPVISRDDMRKFLREKWALPNPISIFTFNQMILSAYQALPNCPIRIKAASANKYVLADSAKRVLDWMLSEKTECKENFMRECETAYQKAAKIRKKPKLLEVK